MKTKALLLILAMVLSISILSGCTTKPQEQETGDNSQTEVDATSSASQAVDEASFKEKISKDGNFIIITSSDLSFSEDLIVEGTFENSGGSIARSIALAQYDEEGNAIEFNLTVPNLVIKSENALIEYGTVKGNVYVEAPGFRTKETTIEGNLYFATEELMNEFEADEGTEITQEIAVKEYE
ncbi:MAG: hypothetical protein M0Q14_09875 [Tissierellaceae bacterium]|nr:hypothetical protein [Tissierellaceae bacterium]